MVRNQELWYFRLQEKISNHLALAQWFKEKVEVSPGHELVAPVPLNTVCFRCLVEGKSLEEENKFNEELMHRLNKSGEVFLTHVIVNGKFTIRIVIGQTEVEKRHVEKAWRLIEEYSNHH